MGARLLFVWFMTPFRQSRQPVSNRWVGNIYIIIFSLNRKKLLQDFSKNVDFIGFRGCFLVFCDWLPHNPKKVATQPLDG